MDRYWGTKFMQRNGQTPRVKTTARMVPTADVIATSATFFPHLLEIQTKHQLLPSLPFNADEFFMLLMQNRKWTWAKKGAQTVPLRVCRLGFTRLLVICAMGPLVRLACTGLEQQSRPMHSVMPWTAWSKITLALIHTS